MKLTFVVELTAEPVDPDERLTPADLRHAVMGVLRRQLTALYGNHWLLPMARADAILVNVEKLFVTQAPGEEEGR